MAGGDLLVVSRGSHNVLRYDGTTGAFVGVFIPSPGLNNPFAMEYGGDGNLYISKYVNANVTKHDPVSGAFLGTFATGFSGPTSITFRRPPPGGTVDTDGDGVDDGDDLCPGTPSGEPVDGDGCGASQLDADNDGVSDADDLCPGTPAGDPVNGDGCGASQLDTDNDGVSDDADMCVATSFPDNVGTSKLNPNHWRVDSADNFTFEQGKTKKGKGGSGGSYTMADTAGCTCEQIIVELDLGKGHVKHGCSNSAMADWVAFVNGQGNKVASQATLNASFDDEFELNAGQLPTEFDLLAAYPNPFNPQTTISFTMPESAEVHLAVYDMLGREVAMLVNGVLEAGTHQARFDAGHLPGGGYIYRLTTPQGEFTKMMMLMK